MKLAELLNHPAVTIARRISGELACGLSLAWFALLLLELARPTLVSATLNLNLLLVLAAVLWLAGSPAPGLTRRPYAAAALSAILVAAISLAAAPSGTAAWFPPLAAFAAFGLTLATAKPTTQ